MIVELFINSSENNRIGKSLSLVNSLECSLKEDCSKLEPTIIVNTNSDIIRKANYMHIPYFERYYFIDNIEPMPGGRFLIHARVDVLESFKVNILQLDCVLEGTENNNKNFYLPSESWVTNVKNSTDIVNFPSGLSEEGNFILITAGG